MSGHGESPHIAVIGAGAIGGYLGAKLARHGARVTLIDGWPDHVEAVRSRGLRIDGVTPDEGCTVQLPILHIGEVQQLVRGDPVDVAMIATKSYDTGWATELILPYLAHDGYLISLQNGLNEEEIARRAGWTRTAGCIVMLAGELIGPGHVVRSIGRHEPPMVEFRLGEPNGLATPRLETLARLIARFDGVEVTGNLWGERWSKLCINAIRNGISAATGLSGNERDSVAELRRFAIRIADETVRVGRAAGFVFDHVASLKADVFLRAGTGDPAAFAEADRWIRGSAVAPFRSDQQRPSMAQDIAKGRRTEIEAINGIVLRKGAAMGIATPANAALVQVVTSVERGTLAPHPDNVLNLERRLAGPATERERASPPRSDQ